MTNSELRPVAAWTKWLAVFSLLLLGVSTVWEFIDVGFTAYFWMDAALFFFFLSLLWVNVLSHPTRR